MLTLLNPRIPEVGSVLKNPCEEIYPQINAD
jgi:hypothetical protein